MTSQEQHEPIWVVVKVWRGFPAVVEAYRDKQYAYAREQVLRIGMNIDYDETDVFEVMIKDTVSENC